MELSEVTGQLSKDSEALNDFRDRAMEELPASDSAMKLVQREEAKQRQQDPHEFLSQLLDSLGTAPQVGEALSSPRVACDRARLEALEKELTASVKIASCAKGNE